LQEKDRFEIFIIETDSDRFQGLQEALNTNLGRATRDNDLIYVSPIPPPGQLSAILPAGMVKPILPSAISQSLDWLKEKPGYPLFGGLVPYGVHLALGKIKIQSFDFHCALLTSPFFRNLRG